MVNGLVWPKMNVDRAAYRFRILDGSTARFYNLSFSNGMPFTVIGTEGGYLKSAVTVTNILIAPGERFDVIVGLLGDRGRDQRDPAELGIGTVPRRRSRGPRHHRPDHAVRRRQHERAEGPEDFRPR